MALILSLDQGTTSTRAVLFDMPSGKVLGEAHIALTQHFPEDGWVEHDASEIWQHSQAVMAEALRQASVEARDITAMGLTNQRETTVLWERATGKPLYNAIVWQDRRTAEECAGLKLIEAEVTKRTGLLLDPYFSATKLRWLLDKVPDGQARAARGELAFGTIDSWLIWKLTGGQVHATDATNASRTMLFNIHTQAWDAWLLELFNIPSALLPEVRDCAADYGVTADGMAIRGVAGDQQAAAVGQACLQAGDIKSTYGTGCFVLFHTGAVAVPSSHRLLTTTALRLAGVPTYALEGSIFMAGAAVQWLCDGLGLVKESREVDALAKTVPDSGGVVLVPAFTGLGAPYWDAEARGAILGLTRDSTRAHVARATLEAMAYQTRDLLFAMQADADMAGAALPAILRVDGGLSQSNLMLQLLADVCERVVERPVNVESTALGAAWLAALGAGAIGSLAEVAPHWQRAARFEPSLSSQAVERYYKLWKPAVARVRTDGQPWG